MNTKGSSTRKYLLAGILTIVPIWITWLIVKFVLQLLRQFGSPAVTWIAYAVRPFNSTLAAYLLDPLVESVMAIILVLLVFYGLGWIATKVIGRRLIATFDALMHRIPLVQTIYGSVQKFLTVLQQQPDGVQRVVLIDFPSPEMKTVGFVTRTLKDEDTGRHLAAVYVPTTPNPTSGYLEIVPLEKVISTNWTVDEAMAFIISGGAVAPPKMNYEQSVGAPPEPAI